MGSGGSGPCYSQFAKDFAASAVRPCPNLPPPLRVNAISSTPDVTRHMVRGDRRIDFTSRIKARLRALRAQLERPDALLEIMRNANATFEPQKVASWLVEQAEGWIPAPCWAVVALDVNGQLAVLANIGLAPATEPSVWAAANWVVRHGTEFITADLSKDDRAGSKVAATVVAFPLYSRQRVIGVLIGLDPQPSSTAPAFGSALLSALRTTLEPAAIALESALAVKKAEELSITDDLTHLHNSRYLNLVLRREAKRASRSGRPLSLLFIDLDGFKNVNTKHGHLAGSKALVEAAAIVKGSARETDVAARYGGDEFSVILPDTGREGAVSVAERIRDRFRAFRFLKADGLAVRVTASIGVATLPDVAGSAEELLRAADKAMYKVKNSGKDGVFVAVEE